MKKGRERLLCKFENDAWYEHINDPVRNVTVKSIRHRGNHRRFIAQEGSDKIFQEIKHLASMDRLYTKEELVDLVEEPSRTYQILDAEEWDS